MKKFLDIAEARGDTAVFTFGRFNPPTIGHQKLLDKVASVAKSNPGAPYYIFASHSENPKKDPLPYVKKVAYMKKMFSKHSRNITTTRDRTVFELAVTLHNKGHRAIVMVVGSDRVTEFDTLLNKYNGVEGRHGYYGFDNIEVVSAGERDPDAEGVTGMSASKMRAAASANDYDTFKLGLPKNFNSGMSLFKDVRKFMGIRESFIEHQVNMTEEDVIRDMYIENKIFCTGDIVEDEYSGVSGAVVRRGTNYLVFAESDGTTHKRWLYEVRRVKQDKDVEDMKGTQPAKYFAKDADGDKMSTATKKARARHFAKGDSREPAPGDADADTKPSKYTKKYKKMFGEKDIKIPLELLKLYNLGMKLPAGTPKHKEVMKKIDKLRKDIKEEIKYPKVKENKDGEKYLSADYKNFKSEKPSDSATKEEMQKLKKFGERRTKEVEESVKKHDADPSYAMKEYMDSKNLKYSQEEIDKINVAGSTISRHYKNLHQRARPWQMSKEMNMDINVMRRPSDSMNTPAYPSGHSLQSRLVAEYYAEKYPDHKKELIKAADECGVGRVMAGWHYPSDHKHGVKLAKEALPILDISSDVKESSLKKVYQRAYNNIVKDYTDMVKKGKGKHSNSFYLSRAAMNYGFDSIKPIKDYINSLVKSNELPKELSAENEKIEEDNKRIPRKKGQPANSDKHSDLYTDENPKGTIHGLKFATVQDAKDSVKKIENSGKKHAHKIQAAIAMEQRAREMGKKAEADVYRAYIEKMKKITKQRNEELDMVKTFQQFQLDEKIEGLVNKSKQTGVPYSILKKSYDRGMAAWKGGHRPGASQQQWAFARVNSMLTGGKADPDLQKQIRAGGYKKKKKSKSEDFEEDAPCWDTHKQVGMKKKNGKMVPNCVPKEEKILSFKEHVSNSLYDHAIMESEYQGRKVKLNDPFRLPSGSKKKFGVYVKNDKGNIVKVTFGDPNMGINRDDPEARKSFRARHQCDTNPGPKWKARYWSCYQWRAGSKVDN